MAAICRIKQEEIFSSGIYDDTLDPANAATAANLEEDLNYIRSVLKSFFGGIAWYDIPTGDFSGVLNAFPIQHYTAADDPTKEGYHKDIIADSITINNGKLEVNSGTNFTANFSSVNLTASGAVQLSSTTSTASLTSQGQLQLSSTGNNINISANTALSMSGSSVNVTSNASAISLNSASTLEVDASNINSRINNLYIREPSSGTYRVLITSSPGSIVFNNVLSSANMLIDLQQGYKLYSDNQSPLGGAGSRLWLDGPAGTSTGIVIGPRSGLNYFDIIRLRASRTYISSDSTVPLEVYTTKTAADIVSFARFRTSDGSGWDFRVDSSLTTISPIVNTTPDLLHALTFNNANNEWSAKTDQPFRIINPLINRDVSIGAVNTSKAAISTTTSALFEFNRRIVARSPAVSSRLVDAYTVDNDGFTINVYTSGTQRILQLTPVDANSAIWGKSLRYFFSGGVWHVGVTQYFRIQSDTGYVTIGSRNSSYTHFNTDRPSYYFDKKLTIRGGISFYQLSHSKTYRIYVGNSFPGTPQEGDIWFRV